MGSKLTEWLRVRLRDWLIGPPPKPGSIEVMLDGEIRRVAILGTAGLTLRVCHGKSIRLISASQVADQERFWAAWRAWSPDTLVWEDGSPLKM